jgi:hypothetical protein
LSVRGNWFAIIPTQFVGLLRISFTGSECAHRQGDLVSRRKKFRYLHYLIPIPLLRGLKEGEKMQKNPYSLQELEENIPIKIDNIFG